MENLVISVPRLEIHRPPISTAIVCNVIKQAGHPVEALDLNIKFYNFLEQSEKFYDFDDVWASERPITKEEHRKKCKTLWTNYERGKPM
jgi:hypothetical protein